jgi:hypothetical protein
MASIKNEMIRIAENFFTAQLHAHRNASFPHTPSVEQPTNPADPTTPAQPKVSLPRRIYILLRNGRPLDTFTDPDTADYEMHLCIEGDNRVDEYNDYEIIESRLCYAKMFQNKTNEGV